MYKCINLARFRFIKAKIGHWLAAGSSVKKFEAAVCGAQSVV